MKKEVEVTLKLFVQVDVPDGVGNGDDDEVDEKVARALEDTIRKQDPMTMITENQFSWRVST